MSTETTRAATEDVSVTRTLERQNGGLIVEYELESVGRESVSVRLADGIPTEGVAELGFHEEYRPSEWTRDDGRLEFQTTLEPGVEQSFVLGIIPEDGVELEYDFGEPAVRIVDDEHSDDEESGVDEPTAESATPGSVGLFGRAKRSLLGGGSESAETYGDENDGLTSEQMPSDETEPDVTDTDSAGDDEEASDDETTEDGTDDLASVSDSDTDDESTDEDEVDTDATADETDTDETDTDDETTDAEDTEAEEMSPQTEPVDRSGTDSELVSALVSELESGSVSDEELGTLREHLGGDTTEEVRLAHVQKRLSDFEAYTEALEELIDDHGTGETVVDELHERLDELEERQASTEEGLDTLASSVETSLEELESTLEELEAGHTADIEALETSLSETRRDIEALREAHREDVEAVRGTIEEETAALQADIDAFDSVRQTIVAAFESPGGADLTRDGAASAESDPEDDEPTGTTDSATADHEGIEDAEGTVNAEDAEDSEDVEDAEEPDMDELIPAVEAIDDEH